MRVVSSLINAFWTAGSLFFGATLVCTFLNLFGAKESLQNSASFVFTSPWSLVFGIFSFTLGLVFIVATLWSLRKEQYIAFENPSGEVTISVAAVEEFVLKTGKEFLEIKELYPSIVPKKDGVSILIKAVLWGGFNIPEVTEKVQHEVKKQVQTILGIENISQVEMKVTKIETKGTELPIKKDLFDDEQFQ